MAQVYRTVIGNTEPVIQFTCQRNGTVINITNATVTVAIRNERTGETTNAVQTCTVDNGTLGLVSYRPLAADFPTEDRYIGDVKIVQSGGAVERLAELLVIIVRPAIS